MQVGRAETGLQAWSILAPQLPWQALAEVPALEVEQHVLPSLCRVCDEVSIGASQDSQAAHAAATQLVQVRHVSLLRGSGRAGHCAA